MKYLKAEVIRVKRSNWTSTVKSLHGVLYIATYEEPTPIVACDKMPALSIPPIFRIIMILCKEIIKLGKRKVF